MELENGFDYLFLVGSEDGTNWFLPDAALAFLGNLRTGSTIGFVNDSFDLTAMADVLSGFYFGFGLYSDSSIAQDGVYIDNLELYREPIIISSYDYDYYEGTSMASPYVAGVAGLVKAQNPNYTHFQIRNAILNTVDYNSSLTGKVLTEGRINAFKAVTYLAPPTNLTSSIGDGSVTLSWDANNEKALTSYDILYTDPSGKSSKLNVGNVTYYKVSGLINGTRYVFTVRAIGNFPVAGVIEGPFSTSITETPSGPGAGGGGGGGGG
jgi:subtilisin family serine protease